LNDDPTHYLAKILHHIGEDPRRDGLVDTPRRVVASWEELFSGYKGDPKAHLETVFSVPHDQMITLNGIEFFSTCERHMLPFFGTADVSYIPGDGGVVGLSKLARVVDGYARRLQVQERLTDKIADAIESVLEPRGVAVRLRARHFCMMSRGVKNHGEMTTTALRGAIRAGAAKSEWLAGLPS